MRFMVLLKGGSDHFEEWAAATEEQVGTFFAGLQAFSAAVAERGEVVAGEGLDNPKTARTIRPGPERAVTDGPYAETVEQLGGFYVVDLPDMDTAIELARLLPDGWDGNHSIAVEVRPVVTG